MPCKFLFTVIFFSEAGERGEGGGVILGLYQSQQEN